MLKILHNLLSISSLCLIVYHLRDTFLITFFSNYVFDKASFLEVFFNVFVCIDLLKCRYFPLDIMTAE